MYVGVMVVNVVVGGVCSSDMEILYVMFVVVTVMIMVVMTVSLVNVVFVSAYHIFVVVKVVIKFIHGICVGVL